MNDPHEGDDPQAASRNAPELLVDHDAADGRRIIISDDLGQRVRLTADQLLVLVTAIRFGVLDPILPSLDLF